MDDVALEETCLQVLRSSISIIPQIRPVLGFLFKATLNRGTSGQNLGTSKKYDFFGSLRASSIFVIFWPVGGLIEQWGCAF